MTEVTNVAMILARDLASKLATPMFLVDPKGDLVYYNEPAERILGRGYAENGAMTREEWSTIFSPRDRGGGAVSADELPLSVALTHHRAAHRPLVITGLDGVTRNIEVAAFPIMPHPGQLVGALAILWESD